MKRRDIQGSEEASGQAPADDSTPGRKTQSFRHPRTDRSAGTMFCLTPSFSRRLRTGKLSSSHLPVPDLEIEGDVLAEPVFIGCIDKIILVFESAVRAARVAGMRSMVREKRNFRFVRDTDSGMVPADGSYPMHRSPYLSPIDIPDSPFLKALLKFRALTFLVQLAR